MTDLKIFYRIKLHMTTQLMILNFFQKQLLVKLSKEKGILVSMPRLHFKYLLITKHPKNCFSCQDFELQLIEAIIMTIITDSCFDQTILKKTLVNKLNGQINHSTISKL